MSNTQQTRIWLGDLSKYVSGELSGEWLDLPMAEEELREKYNKYTNNGQTEFFIADWECPVRSAIGEYTSPFAANEIAEKLESFDEDDLSKLIYLIDENSYSFEDALNQYEDVTFYKDMRLKEVAESLVDDGCFGEIPKTLIYYIDYEAIARDLRYDGYYETELGVFHFN